MNINKYLEQKWAESLVTQMQEHPPTVPLRSLPSTTPMLITKRHLNFRRFEAGLEIYRQIKDNDVLIPELIGVVLVLPLKKEERMKSYPDILGFDREGLWITSTYPLHLTPWIFGIKEDNVRSWTTTEGDKWKMQQVFYNAESLNRDLFNRLQPRMLFLKPGTFYKLTVCIETMSSITKLYSIKGFECGDIILDNYGREILKIQKNALWRTVFNVGPKHLRIQAISEHVKFVPIGVVLSILIMSFLGCTLSETYT